MLIISLGHSFSCHETLFNITPTDDSLDIFGCPLEKNEHGFLHAFTGIMCREDVVKLRDYLNDILKETENA